MNVPDIHHGLRGLRIRSSAVVCCLAFTVAPLTALAHVTISPSSLRAGAEDELIFRCPDESANAATVKLVVQLPVDHPIASVKLRPIPGWRSSVTMRKLTVPITTDDGEVVAAVDTITWSGGRIDPGEYQDFAILAGPIPTGAKELAFEAVQTYSNGEVVRWIELRGPGEAEPAHPAPVLHVHSNQRGSPGVSLTGARSSAPDQRSDLFLQSNSILSHLLAPNNSFVPSIENTAYLSRPDSRCFPCCNWQGMPPIARGRDSTVDSVQQQLRLKPVSKLRIRLDGVERIARFDGYGRSLRLSVSARRRCSPECRRSYLLSAIE